MSLEFHDFVVVVAALDAGWSRAATGEAGDYATEVWGRVDETHGTLARAVGSFATELSLNHEAWLEGRSKSGSVLSDLHQPLEKRLFSVQSWLPFGHLDCLSLFAVDDIDAAHVVVGRYDKTVEEVTTAFCPKMETFRNPSSETIERYGVAPVDAGVGREIFVDFLDLMHDRIERSGESPHLLESSSIQRARPLALLTRIRLYPLLTMGRALTALEAIYRLAAETVVVAHKELLERCAHEEATDAALYSKEDVRNTRLCFLDLQDEEEIGVFLTGNNFTAMMALIAALQKLTVERLLTCEAEAAAILFGCRAVREVMEIGQVPADRLREILRERIGNCHLFRWSRSVASVAPHLARGCGKEESDAVPSGFLAVDTLVGLMPGHQADAECILQTIGSAESQLRSGYKGTPYRLHLLGMNDLLLRWERSSEPGNAASKRSMPRDLIAVGDAIKLWPELLESVNRDPARGGRRNFTAWESLVSIPIPEGPLFHEEITGNHECVLHKLMLDLKKCARLACMDDGKIREKTRKAGFPAPSTRPLILLCQSFSQVLTNPLIFDVVLDYVDLIETLAHAVTSESLHSDRDRPDHYTTRPPWEVVEQLGLLLGAIDDAFELRLRRIYPEDAVRDWSLDLRSQNHQVFLAADAVLKCAIAVFRKDVLGVHREKVPGHPDAETVRRVLGVVLRLGYHSGMSATELKALRLPIKYGDKTNVARLAIFNADFPHLRSILVYADFFHESFHLIFEEMTSIELRGSRLAAPEDIFGITRQSRTEGQPEADPDIAVAVREIFVHMMMLLFIFDGDRELLLRDHLEGLSNSDALGDPSVLRDLNRAAPAEGVRESDESEKERRCREERTRRFARLVFDALAPVLWLESVLGKTWQSEFTAVDLCRLQGSPELGIASTIANFTRESWRRVESNRGAFADFDWIFPPNDPGKAQEARSIFEGEMGWLYTHTVESMAGMWESARAVFAHHVTRLVAESFGPDQGQIVANEGEKKPEERVRKFLRKTNATILADQVAERYKELQSDVDKNILDGWAGEDPAEAYSSMANRRNGRVLIFEGEAIDANLIVRRSLYHYLNLYRKKTTVERTLPRTTEGRIDRDCLRIRAHEIFLLDRTAVNHFCCVPAERRKRTGRDIAVLKTMWAIAGRNRARRLAWLVQQTRKDPASQAT